MKLNLAGKIVKFFLENQSLTILILIATIIGGVGSFFSTPKQYNPTIVLPAFQVIIPYPGATADEVEKFITQELEEKISDIEGVDKIYARSIDGGQSIVTVIFEIGNKLEDAKIKLIQKIQENLDKRTFTIGEPIIKSINPEDVPILTFGFLSPKHSQNELRMLSFEIMRELRKVPKIANLEIHGGENKALRIVLDPAKLKVRKVSVQQIKKAISASNFNAFAGSLRDGKNRNLIEIAGNFQGASEAKKIIIAPGLQLQDVAKVYESYQEKTSFVKIFSTDKENKMTSKDAVFISIAKRKGSSTIEVAEKAKTALDAILQQKRFKNLIVYTFRNDGKVAQKAIGELGKNLFVSVFDSFAGAFAFSWLEIGKYSGDSNSINYFFSLFGGKFIWRKY